MRLRLVDVQESWEEALYNCDRALEVQPTYVKALQRRAAAFEKLERLDEALAGEILAQCMAFDAAGAYAATTRPPYCADVEAVVALEPANAAAASTVARLKAAVSARNEKLKDEMMGKLKEAGNWVLGKFGLSLDNFKAVQDPATGSYSISFQR